MNKILLLIAVVICGCTYLKKYPQDNFVEELIEEAIEDETGVDVDLTPFSPE